MPRSAPKLVLTSHEESRVRKWNLRTCCSTKVPDNALLFRHSYPSFRASRTSTGNANISIKDLGTAVRLRSTIACFFWALDLETDFLKVAEYLRTSCVAPQGTLLINRDTPFKTPILAAFSLKWTPPASYATVMLQLTMKGKSTCPLRNCQDPPNRNGELCR